MMPTAGTAQRGDSKREIRAAHAGIAASVPATDAPRQDGGQSYRGVGGIGRPALAASTAASASGSRYSSP